MSLLTDLNSIATELRSNKPASRKKAAEQLDVILTSSQSELLTLFRGRSSDSGGISYATLFNSAVEATIQHAVKVEEADGTKNFQTLRNKNCLFRSIVGKLVDYNLEEKSDFIPKTELFHAFANGIENRSAIMHFSTVFLNILERGIYKSPTNVLDLKVNEYSRILSYLFQIPMECVGGLVARMEVLSAINATIELAVQHVQINEDLITYLPQLINYAQTFKDDRTRSEVVRMFYLYVSQLSVDYHYTICTEMQELLPVIYSFYNFHMRTEVKEIFFHSIYLYLHAIYPHINNGNISTLGFALNSNWHTMLHKLKTMVDMEIREQNQINSRSQQALANKCLEYFVKMSALITYLFHWHVKANNNNNEDEPALHRKVAKPADKLESILELVETDKSSFNRFWLAILGELLTKQQTIINITNLQNLLKLSLRILLIFGNEHNLSNIRLCLTSLLNHERKFVKQKSINVDYCREQWTQIVDFLIVESSTSSEIIKEKQHLLQALVRHGKLNSKHCTTLLSNYIANSIMKRSECILTIREILIKSEICELDKTSEVVSQVLNWLNESHGKLDARMALHNIEPIDIGLVADTSAIAVINFLNETQTFEDKIPSTLITTSLHSIDNLQLLLYKYNRRFVCLEEHGKEIKRLQNEETAKKQENVKKNCLFQSNYELLMRLLNFETSKKSTFRDISCDLVMLLKMCSLLECLLEYGVLTQENYMQCPLIKRIGFFLSHLELQMKSNNPSITKEFNAPYTIICEILQRLSLIFGIFTRNPLLLQYTEAQPLDELITFLTAILKYSVVQQLKNDFENWSLAAISCLEVLAKLCASSTHINESFACISNYRMNVKKDLVMLLRIIEIFCSQNTAHACIADWFVEKLKTIFRLYYTNIETMQEIIALMPAVLNYVQQYDDPLQNMLIALYSLLKIALKKSYPSHLTVKLIDGIRNILKQCDSIFGQQNFTNICLSVTKFLPFPGISVQFGTVNVISALLDINWLHRSKRSLGLHFDFCKQLYEHIDLNALPTNTTIDLEQNTKAVTIQMLTAILTFSSYFRSSALEQLVFYCAKEKLKELDLTGFQQIAAYSEISLKQFTRPYVDHLIHAWTAKLLPITHFPYFLCGGSLNEFVLENLPRIVISILLHGKPQDIEALTCHKPKAELLRITLPIACALILPYHAECEEAQDFIYKRNIEKLVDNLKAFDIDLLNNQEKDISSWQTIYNTLILLQDEQHFHEIISFPLYYQSTQWYNLSASSASSCLAFYICGNGGRQTDFLAALVAKGPVTLVHAFGALKRNVLSCLNAIDALKHFAIFCTAADIAIDFIPFNNKLKDALQNCGKFLVRDTLCFIIQILKSANEYNMQNTALIFLKHFVRKRIVFNGFCKSVLVAHLNDIFKALIYVADNATTSDIEDNILSFMTSLLADPDDEMLKAIVLLDEFPITERFLTLRQTQCEIQSSDGEKDMSTVVTSFLRLNNRGIEGVKSMRQFLANNKEEMEYHNDLLYDLIKRLIEVVRTTKNAEFSLEAAKCLGEIGSLKINSTSYYFQTDVRFYEDENIELESVSYFLQCALLALEKSFVEYKPETYEAVCDVAEYVVNTAQAEHVFTSFPYFSVFKSSGRKKQHFETSIERVDWLGALNNAHKWSTFDKWICTFVSNVFDNCNWQTFKELAALDSSFADASLLPFVKLLLENKQQHIPNLLVMLEHFFSNFVEAQTASGYTIDSIYKEKRVINKMLNICECVRMHNEWKVPINLLHVVKACNYCQAYFMAIMYLELWAADEKSRTKESTYQKIISNEHFQECAKKAYKSVGCSDAIAGFLNPQLSRLEFFELNNNWSDILVEASNDDIMCDELYTAVLKRNGMLSLAGLGQEKNSIDFEVCWRLANWDVVVEGHSKVNTLNDMEMEYEKHHYNALKCLFNREENNSLAALANARQCVLVILKEISIDCLQSVYKYLTWLQLLQQVEDFCQVQFGTQAMSGAAAVADIFKKWQTESELPYGSFQCKEMVLSHQIALFQTAGVRANRKINALYQNNPITLCSLKCIRACKAAGEMNLAKRNMAILRKMPITSAHVKANVFLEDADLCFKTGHAQITRTILQSILRTPEMATCPEFLTAMRMYGEYLLESNMENFDSVQRKYLTPTIEKLSHYENNAIASDSFKLQTFPNFKQRTEKSVFEVIAKYADRKYTQLDTFIKSESFQIRRRIIEQNRSAANAISEAKQNRDRDKNYSVLQMKRFANLDEKDIEMNEEECSANLCIAIENYLKLCKIDETTSTAAVYRIIALWFANCHNDDVHKKIKEYINEVPSYKFICALNQITARLNSSNENFLEVLRALLVRCAQDHPYHTLYHLYSLAFAYSDGAATASAAANNGNNRVNIAKEIIKQAMNTSNAECIKQMEIMLPALINFANVEVDKKKNNISDALRRLKNLSAVHCPTITLPVSANKTYTITSISKWEEKISLVGGVNAPKKLVCLCSDGIRRPQLLKGRDDLRQDAVMQQVFSSINEMLASERTAVERKLHIRTYKIVPLSMRSGILEWCENAIPIGVYLADKERGAHQRYFPQDFVPHKCRQLASQPDLKSNFLKQHKMYKYICENLTPAFHYFFLEKFLVPGIWFERRLAYTNSVATTSMVGYIVGLGDRHAQNILIDEKSAEVIHIDFGIAFEQGKIMPTPETVPFRLTRDMVRPMGVCETNGVFRKSCEATMQVLRRNQAVIMTILEVLLYDPLYMWNVVPQLTANSSDETANNMAQRALLDVQNKLEGKQMGVLDTSDVAAQVQRLINEAASTINLCQLYPGWDPYL